MASFSSICQILLKFVKKTIYILTTKNLNYLIIRFSRCFFFFLYNILFFKRAIPLNLDRIYIIPLDLPWSLFAPLQCFRKYLRRYLRGYLRKYLRRCPRRCPRRCLRGELQSICPRRRLWLWYNCSRYTITTTR